MTLSLNLRDIQELNYIRSLLTNEDPENQKLGVTLFRSSKFVNKKLSTLCYVAKSGKEIPINWYFRKIDESDGIRELERKLATPQAITSTEEMALSVYQARSFNPQMLLPIIDSILKGESNFKIKVTFTFDHIYSEDDRVTRLRQDVISMDAFNPQEDERRPNEQDDLPDLTL